MKLPISSFFFVSTEITGWPATCAASSVDHATRLANARSLENPPESIRRTRFHAQLDSLIFARRLTSFRLLRCSIFSGRESAAGQFPPPSFVAGMEELASIADTGTRRRSEADAERDEDAGQ